MNVTYSYAEADFMKRLSRYTEGVDMFRKELKVTLARHQSKWGGKVLHNAVRAAAAACLHEAIAKAESREARETRVYSTQTLVAAGWDLVPFPRMQRYIKKQWQGTTVKLYLLQQKIGVAFNSGFARLSKSRRELEWTRGEEDLRIFTKKNVFLAGKVVFCVEIEGLQGKRNEEDEYVRGPLTFGFSTEEEMRWFCEGFQEWEAQPHELQVPQVARDIGDLPRSAIVKARAKLSINRLVQRIENKLKTIDELRDVVAQELLELLL